MVPIISPPPWITDFVGKMSLSYHHANHMARYATGLIVSKTKTVADMGSLFLHGPTGRAMNHFVNGYEWSDTEANTERLTFLQDYNETRWNRNGIAIIDDTIIEKTGKNIPYTGWFYDHSKDRYIWGHNIVSLHYADKKTNYPIDYRLYVKEGDACDEFKTKIQFAMDLVSYGIKAGLPVLTYVFDSWYMCKDLADFVEAMKKFWIGACKSDLLVRVSGEKFATLAEYGASLPKEKFTEFEVNGRKLLVYTKLVYFKSLERKARVIISKDGKDTIYLATNRKDHATKILAAYICRWKVETFYKDAKQNLGLGKYQFRDIDAIKKHWHIVFLAHSLLRLGASESILGKLVLSSSIGKSARKACMEMIEQLLYYALESGRNVCEIFKFLSRGYK